MSSEEKNKIFIRTFGCQMNDYDSERMYRLMERAGWSRAAGPEEADLIIVNTCSVRDKPEHKAVSEVGWMKRFKKRRPGTILAIAGCVAQQLGDGLLKKIPALDLVIGTHAIDRLPELVANCRAGKVAETAWDYESLFDFENIAPAASEGLLSWKGTRASGFVPIMRGCDKHCSFCIVPSVRGHEVSRPMEDILAEVRMLLSAGVRDVTLLGQIVNRYGRGLSKMNLFPDLIDAVIGLEGLFRLRFASSHPTYVTKELTERFARHSRLASHLHLPVQSGSDRILKDMRRGHTVEEYLEKVRMLREVRPEISITSDIIVGYPGETEEEFQATLDLIREAGFDGLFAFKYSPRPGTPSEKLGETLTEEEKSERLTRVHARAMPVILQKNRAMAGRVCEVLVEGANKGDPERKFGRTSCNRIVHFAAAGCAAGDLVPVRIDTGYQNSLAGSLLTEHP